MISVPLWAVIVLACWAAALVIFVRDERASGHGMIPSPPMLGCAALLLAVIATLAVLLVHAWGWL